MSGTSLDGLDASLVRLRVAGGSYRIDRIGHQRTHFSKKWKTTALRIAEQDCLRESYFYGAAWAEFAAACVQSLLRKTRISSSRVAVIGAHGQSVVHLPRPRPYLDKRVGITIQLGDFSRLAVRTGIPVVGNFRPADLAAGGNGAPLAPHAHAHLFGRPGKRIAVQNLGGIGNITVLQSRKVELAFDTGPGNVWIDMAVRWKTRGRKQFDRNGSLARKGTPKAHLVAQLLKHPFFLQNPPKSAGWEQFGETYLIRFRRALALLRTEDAVATVTQATAEATARAINQHVLNTKNLHSLVFCGGGAKNRYLINLIGRHIRKNVSIHTSSDFLVPVDEVEAVSFALMAVETLRKQAGNEIRATGAKYPVICGEVAYGRPK